MRYVDAVDMVMEGLTKKLELDLKEHKLCTACSWRECFFCRKHRDLMGFMREHDFQMEILKRIKLNLKGVEQ